jgi:hypothetical protein
MNNQNMTDEEFQALQTKINLVLSMAGKDTSMMMTVLSYALAHAALFGGLEFSSVVRVLAEVYEEMQEVDEDEEDDDV